MVAVSLLLQAPRPEARGRRSRHASTREEPMKGFVICLVIGGALVFGLMGLQMGMIPSADEGEQVADVEGEEEEDGEAKPKQARARFPRDLAPAAQAGAVPQAAEYTPGP